MPPTPAERGWGAFESHPHVRVDSEEQCQSTFEQQAEQIVEQMVEDELMLAGKQSGLFGLGSLGPSATSTHPSMSSCLSHLTGSHISIESCASDEERNDANAHYQLSNESELDTADLIDEQNGLLLGKLSFLVRIMGNIDYLARLRYFH